MAFPFFLLLFRTPIQLKKAVNLNILPFCVHKSNSPYITIYYFFSSERVRPLHQTMQSQFTPQ